MQSRSTLVRSVVLVAVAASLGLGAAACGRYSLANLKAMKAFKEGNDHYQASEYSKAAASYEEVLKDQPNPDPQLAVTYFFLANSYDNLYKPARKGEPQNDAYLDKAVQYYQLATEKIADPVYRKLAYEYLIAAYGPTKLDDLDKAVPLAKDVIAMDPNDPTSYTALGGMYENAGEYDQAEAMFQKAVEVKPDDATVYLDLAGYYNRQGQFDKTMDALNAAAQREPNNPEAWHRIATYYSDKVLKDFSLSNALKAQYIQKGLEADDRALALNPNYVEAMIYKNILLRFEGNMEKDPAKRAALYKQADDLRDKGLDLQKQQNATAAAAAKGKKPGGGGH